MPFGTSCTDKFLLALMGVHTPRFAHAKPSARPPMSMSGNVLVHVSAESPSNIYLNPRRGCCRFQHFAYIYIYISIHIHIHHKGIVYMRHPRSAHGFSLENSHFLVSSVENF